MNVVPLSYSMMSACLLDDEFYAVCPWMSPIKEKAQRAFNSRKALFDRVQNKKGCSGCSKRRAEKEQTKMETEHGLLFTSVISDMLQGQKHTFSDLKSYVAKKLKNAGVSAPITRLQMYTVVNSGNSKKKETVLLEI